MKLFQRSQPAGAALLFPGGISSPPESFAGLRNQGIEVSEESPEDGCRYSLRLEHPQWGRAQLVAPRELALPPPDVIGLQLGLDDDERERLLGAGHSLLLSVEATRRHVLRDRKHLLRFGRAILGSDGVGLLDVSAQLTWSPARLDEELAHDADLDIEALYCLHAVQEEVGDGGGDGDDGSGGDSRRSARGDGNGDGDRSGGGDDDGGGSENGAGCAWLHSHGLAELGAFDFDVLRPSDDLLGMGHDGLRALAFAIVEGSLGPSEDRFALCWPGGDIRMVPVAEFSRRAPADERRLREDDDHAERRSVACDPVGLMGRLFGGVRASRFLSAPLPENSVFAFSKEASLLMAERARKTLDLFATLGEEFADLELPRLLKLGFGTDDGGVEHLWFELHGLKEGRGDLTLLNSPHAVPGMKEGDRGWHELTDLSDWAIFTPAGSITPRNLFPARVLRESRDAIRRAMKEAGG